MTTKDEALALALEALESVTFHSQGDVGYVECDFDKIGSAITAIKNGQAQEPVEVPRWVEVQQRTELAQAIYAAIRKEIPALGPWNVFDADAVQRIVDALPAPQQAQEPLASSELEKAVSTVLEGWTIPAPVRKILETAYYAAPKQAQQAQEPVSDEATDEMIFHGLEAFNKKTFSGHGGNTHKRTLETRMSNAYRAMRVIASLTAPKQAEPVQPSSKKTLALAQEGIDLHDHNAPEYIICAELVRLNKALSGAPTPPEAA